jgi:hypothetical protein
VAFNLVQSETKPTTRALACQIRDLTEVPGERPLKTARLEYLRRELAAGTVVAFIWVVALFNGIRYRINGKHSSHLLADENVVIPAGAKTTLYTYTCETEADLASLWSKYDNKDSVRNNREQLHAHAANSQELANVSQTVLLTAQRAVGIVELGESAYNRASSDKRFETLLAHADFCHWLARLLPLGHKSRIFVSRHGVVDAMYRSWRVNPEKADIFWREMVSGSNPNPNSQSRLLHDHCLAHGAHQGSGATSRSGKPALPWKALASHLVAGWNAWRQGRVVKHFRFTGSIPEVVP